MTTLQIFFILLTFVLPPLLAWAARRDGWVAFDGRVCFILGWLLLFLETIDFVEKHFNGTLTLQSGLPMQLCDWTLFAAAAALLLRSQIAFDLAYFWGLAGTSQALLTPAIGPDVGLWRITSFLGIHAGIVIAVLYLLLSRGFRPRTRSLLHIFLGSEIYLAVALLINSLCGANYGFLSAKPLTKSMLDILSDNHWMYILQLNGLAFAFFALLYVPWFIADLIAVRRRPQP